MTEPDDAVARSAAAADLAFDLCLRQLLAVERARALGKQARRHRIDAATAQLSRPAR